MKKVIAIIIIVLVGCTSASKISKISRYESLSIVDFTEYSNRNFLITTEPYAGKYKSIGILDYVVRCEVSKIKVTTVSPFNERDFTREVWVREPLDTQSLIDTLYSIDMDAAV